MPILLALAGACVPERPSENPTNWYDWGEQLDVAEPVVFTDQNYDFPAADADGIAAIQGGVVFPVPSGSAGGDPIAFGPDDQWANNLTCQSEVNDALPFELDAVVTIHPRFYFKTSGCEWDSDEKYYGSFFLQDRTGALFMLGDTRVARFSPGDRVRILLRGGKTSYDLDMGYAWDFVEIVEEKLPIYYEVATASFEEMEAADPDSSPIARTWRVEGTVTTEMDTFGQFFIETDGGVQYAISLDSELNRRGVTYPIGTRLQATGPLLYSYSVYTIVILRVGQITVLSN